MSKENVKRWRKVIRSVRANDVNLPESQYPDWLLLALIDIESNGDPSARREDSQYYGLLQIGEDNATDVGAVNSDFDGDGRASIRAFFLYQERYRQFHGYDRELMALLWKGGPGTVDAYKRLLRTEGLEAADSFLASRWGGSPLIYLRRFKREASYWSGGDASLSPNSDVVPGSNSRPSVPAGDAPPKCFVTSGGSLSVSAVAGAAQQTQGSFAKYINGNYKTALNGYVDPSMPSNGDPRQIGRPRRVGYILGDAQLKFYTLNFNDDQPEDFIWPLNIIDILSPFAKSRSTSVGGGRNPKKLGRDVNGNLITRRHKGVDLDTRSDPDQFVYAFAPGEVVRASLSSTYGFVVYMQHEGGLTSRYAHLQALNVEVGDTITRQQLGAVTGVVGLAGTTEGRKTDDGRLVPDHNAVRTPHLHFEIRINKGVLEGGSFSGSPRSNAANVPLNPVAILQGAPLPSDTQEFRSAVTRGLSEARDSSAKTVLQAETQGLARNAQTSYNAVAAASRGAALGAASRKDLWKAEEVQIGERERKLNETVALGEGPIRTPDTGGS